MERRYKRYFVILEAEDQGYEALQGESPKGYGKIEVKNGQGTLGLFCQNLKKMEEKGRRYRWYLVNTKKEKGPIVVDIGPMAVDASGKGEVIWEFNAENVRGSQEAIDQFNVLCLVVESIEGKKLLGSPLVGYIDKEKTQWKQILENYLYDTLKEGEAKPKKEAKQEVEERVKEQTKEKIQQIEVKQGPQLKTEPQREDGPAAEGGKEKAEGGPQPKSIIAHGFEKGLEPKLDQEDPQDQLQNYIERTLKLYPKVVPFTNKLENYEWWQIDYNDQTMYRGYMPFIGYIELMHNPYYYYYPSEYNRLVYYYRHYLFGIGYEGDEKKVKYYLYAIPGTKTKESQPMKGTTGFVYWHPCPGGTVRKETQGYWILHIDAKTGKIIEPLKASDFLAD